MKSYAKADTVKLVHSGKEYFDILEGLIENTQRTLHIQTYIFETDKTGLQVVNSILKARKRGVSVYVLIDAFGSKSFSKQVEKQLLSAGVNFRFFAPLFSSESIFFGRRLHHKIICADKNTALIGGINIADKYNLSDKKDCPWLDYAALVEGELCRFVDQLCNCMFDKSGFGKLNKLDKLIRHNDHGDALVRFSRNDWIKGKNEIHKGYMNAIKEATQSITIVASYFLPGYNFRWLLRKASLKGLEVRIIKTRRSDSASVELAENYMYAFYIRNKIKIYEWPNSVMHGKAMMTDDEWVTIGSYNLNYLSHFISVELNCEIINKSFAKEMNDHLETIIQKDCIMIDKARLEQRYGLFGKLKLWLAYNFHRLIMVVVTSGRKFRKH